MVEGVSKFFGDYQVLDNVSFELGSGKAAVLIGRNGAGKTTLLRCVAGLLRFEGEILVDGISVSDEPLKAKKKIGYLPQIPPVKGDVTGYELFNFYTELHDIDLDADEWFSRFELEDAMDVPIDEYSGGMRQRLFLMMAIAHDPLLTLMDEPMNNLDSIGKNLLVDIINEWKSRGKSFLISGHRITDFIVYADEIILLEGGKLIYHGPVDPLFDLLGMAKLYIYSPDGVLKDVMDMLGGELIGRNRAVITAEDVYSVLKTLVDMGVKNFFVEEPTIDTIIERLGGDVEDISNS